MHNLIRKPHLLFIPHQENNYQPHALRHRPLLIYSLLLVLVKFVATMLLLNLYPNEAEFSTITTKRIIELSNQARAEKGISILRENDLLNQAAALKARDMLAHNYFAHYSPQKVAPWHWFKEVNYNYTYAGENLAMNFSEAEDALSAWLASPTHRDNILSQNYEDIGVAVVVGEINGKETTLVVQLFGQRFVAIAGEETFRPEAREVQVPAPNNQPSIPVENQAPATVEITPQASQQEVTLTSGNSGHWLTKFINFSTRFIFVLLVFIIINLLLTIFIRIEIQHKPIILHSLLVILLGLAMIFFRTHFMEGLGQIIIM